ncbi:efflux RND transporter permease subunit [Fimbriiglobus ruber]|uniref:Cobalt-zinc-cadmium resistance protein CzcA / Cation efflux system protein CusA n=1 Tax=Fimbriiglobus ruber TaxID=1908690 RepID=A0A225D7S5_9BACT|nr:efflux RND transporter permease subunit [Fimbriiglobus ruber]OWK34598.1 Cobalt-zinc-cadmium resistance protein CzcA / Cation efflux system protein CusA [Fimbriiglobus ruber]
MNSSLNPIVFALRHPVTVMAAVAALAVTSALATRRMPVDVFPKLELPIVYIAQPYGGMDPAQMESQLTSYYEGHSLYIAGIHHVESKTIQGMAIIKLFFHPGTDMGQAMAETVGYVNRARAFMPPGTVPPFIVRLDGGSAPVGYLVLESDTERSPGELQDLAILRVRPIFGSLRGVSSPPPVGGNLRTINVNVDPDRLKAYKLTLDDLTSAVAAGNTIIPSGNVRIGDQAPMVPLDGTVAKWQEVGDIPLKPGGSIYVRDVAQVEDGSDIATGYAVVNGKRTVYLTVTKRADASTLDVVNLLKANLPRMQEALPEGVKLRFEFDQSPYVTNAMFGVASEGALGAIFTGLMVLIFLRDWRSVIVVVLNIPLALMGALIALAATGQTVNLMTLGGLALSVGVLVDEATVEVENIHTQMERTDSVAVAVRRGNSETAVPRLLAMLCILAVFVPVFFMQGSARNLFAPLALAVSFAMITSYVLSSTFVPVVSVWLLRKAHVGGGDGHGHHGGFFDQITAVYGRLVGFTVRNRLAVIVAYIAATGTILAVGAPQVGREIFPIVDSGQFQLRIKAPTGTRIERTDELAREAIRRIEEAVGPGNLETSVGYVGVAPSSYPINAVYLWTGGPEEAVLRVALKKDSGVRIEDLKSQLRRDLPGQLKEWLAAKTTADGTPADESARRVENLRLSFEPADIVNEVMSFGSPTPVEVAVYGPNIADNKAHAAKVRAELEKITAIRDLQYGQAQDYPTIAVKLDRAKVGQSGVTVADVGKSFVEATSSSRFVVPMYWTETATGFGYLVQVQVPPRRMDSAREVGLIAVRPAEKGQLLLQDVAALIKEETTPAQYDRLNLRRMISLTGNVEGSDLGRVASAIDEAVKRAGTPPRGVRVDVRGQVEPMREIFSGLAFGLVFSVVSILILLTAYFQSPKLAGVAVAAVPAVLSGVVLALLATGTTLNIQSFMGAVMAVGVAVANAILLVTFAESQRKGLPEGPNRAADAATDGGVRRLRPILMTSLAMLAGMIPMALGLGEGGDQTAPLGRAVIGGVLASTLATLLILPAVFTMARSRDGVASASLDPEDPDSSHYRPDEMAAQAGH